MTMAARPPKKVAATSECISHETLPGPTRPGSPGGAP